MMETMFYGIVNGEFKDCSIICTSKAEEKTTF